MSIWSRIGDALSALASGEPLSAVFEKLRSPPEHSVAFTIAIIALSAKMAKADGLVTRQEVSAFRQVFTIAPEDEDAAARVFNLARQDVAGFEEYAHKIASMFRDRPRMLCNMFEGLFYVAVADGDYHPAENDFLQKVAKIFGLSEAQFRSVRAQFVADAEPDPLEVLGLSPNASIQEARDAWRKAVKESHPDRMIARGVPAEAMRLAQARLVAVNRAWEEIQSREPA